MSKFKKILLNIHLGTLIILLTSFIFNLIFDITLISNLRIVLKILFYVSASILFFYYIRPFKKEALYFGFYIFSPIFIFFSWLIDGIFGSLLASVFLFFFQVPSDVRFENEQIQIKTKFQGFLGSCCVYEVIEKKYYLCEKKIGEFRFEENLYFRKNDIEIQKNTLTLHLKLKDYNEKEDRSILKKSTIEVPLRNE